MHSRAPLHDSSAAILTINSCHHIVMPHTLAGFNCRQPACCKNGHVLVQVQSNVTPLSPNCEQNENDQYRHIQPTLTWFVALPSLAANTP